MDLFGTGNELNDEELNEALGRIGKAVADYECCFHCGEFVKPGAKGVVSSERTATEVDVPDLAEKVGDKIPIYFCNRWHQFKYWRETH